MDKTPDVFPVFGAGNFSLTSKAESVVCTAEAERINGAEVMDRIQAAEKNKQKFLGDFQSSLSKTDADLIAMKERLLYGEIDERGTLDEHQRMLITLVVLTAPSSFMRQASYRTRVTFSA